VTTFVDLTIPITSTMPFNPDHFPPEISTYGSIERDGWAASRLVLSSHLGTHIDAPSHFIAGGPAVDQIPLDVLIGEAQVIDVRHVTSGKPIEPDDLPDIESPRVLLYTGWSEEQLGTLDYFSAHPYLAEAAAARLISRGVRLFGIDSPSVDYHPSETHKVILGNGGVIVENLVNLGLLPGICNVAILPLRLQGVDGSPVRATAMF